MPSHGHGAIASTEGNHFHTVAEYAGHSDTLTHLHIQASLNDGYVDGITSISGSHGHAINIQLTGGSGKHENRQPFTVVNRWRRTA
nr:MAG TPA: Baseplate structural protein [Caudoviricetes sp.]